MITNEEFLREVKDLNNVQGFCKIIIENDTILFEKNNKCFHSYEYENKNCIDILDENLQYFTNFYYENKELFDN